uniref:Serine/threonine-protein kinase ULK3 isoform X1 n=1 Tax=Populus alba TaxID=43335 RepID=A0A4U5PZH0_POPAL|nr:serine/threonine-protein kinase ULK3 isoform X1 [Populus alba]
MDLEATKNLSESHTIGNYILKSKLGESSFSTVWKAENKTTGGEVAVKQVYLSNLNKNLRNCLDCELNFLSFFNHPNIIRLLDVFEDECCMFLVLEFCSGGNLASYLQQHGRSHHIIHRDLKPENILLSGKESDVVLKIADFGLSRRVLPDNYVETVCGSPFYMAPEVLQFQRYDCKVDMWSVGVILFELLNGYPPFRARTNFQLLQNIQSSSCLPFSQHILPGLHPDCVDICSRLLSANPVQRLSFDEFYHHKFLRIKGVGKYHGQ